MHDDLAAMHERLLRQGISPKWARRYRDELDDHLADLVDALVAEGHAPSEAVQLARRRLGSIEALEAAVAVDRRARSMTARLPALYVAAPMLGLAGTVVALATLLVVLAPRLGDLGWLPAAGELAGPAAIAWGVALFAASRRARPGWPVAGMLATLALGALIDLDLTMPSADQAGAVAVALGGPDTGMLLVSMLATVPAFLLIQSRLKAI